MLVPTARGCCGRLWRCGLTLRSSRIQEQLKRKMGNLSTGASSKSETRQAAAPLLVHVSAWPPP